MHNRGYEILCRLNPGFT